MSRTIEEQRKQDQRINTIQRLEAKVEDLQKEADGIFMGLSELVDDHAHWTRQAQRRGLILASIGLIKEQLILYRKRKGYGDRFDSPAIQYDYQLYVTK